MESLPPFPLIVNIDVSNIITTIDPNVFNVMNPVKPKILNTETNEFKTFEEVKISNIVGIYKFEPMLNMDAIFRLCQINSIGNISYMNYQGYSRGNRIESRKKKTNSKCVKCFKNSIGIDMGESLGLKLSQNSLWFSGAKSKESADEALRLLMLEINHINENLNYINKYPEEAIKCLNFIKQSFEGNECFQIDGTRIIVDSSDVIMYGDEMYLNFNSKLYSILSKDLTIIPINSIKSTLTNEIIKDDKSVVITHYNIIKVVKIHTIKNIQSLVVPTTLPLSIINFLVDKLVDFNNFEEYSLNLDWFLTLKSVYDTPVLDIPFEIRNTQFSYGNINYNYNLGFKIKLNVIDRIFKRSLGFVSAYDKDVVKFVRVSLPMDIPEELMTTVKNKSKNPSHKFIIYKTGAVLQSGYHPTLNKIAFEKFMSIINKNINKIKSDD